MSGGSDEFRRTLSASGAVTYGRKVMLRDIRADGVRLLPATCGGSTALSGGHSNVSSAQLPDSPCRNVPSCFGGPIERVQSFSPPGKPGLPINNRQATSSRRGAGCRNSASLLGSGPHSRRSRSTAGPCERAGPCPCRITRIRLEEALRRNRDGAPGHHVRVVVTCASTSAESPRACACRFRHGAACRTLRAYG